MAEYFETRQAAVDAIKGWYKEFQSRPLFFGTIDLYGSKKWIVDYKATGYTNAAFTVLEDLTTELKDILHPSTTETQQVSAEPSPWRELFKEEMLRFLTSPRTKTREQQTGDWWSRDDLKLAVAKAFHQSVEGDLLFREVDAAIDELVKKGESLALQVAIERNGNGYLTARGSCLRGRSSRAPGCASDGPTYEAAQTSRSSSRSGSKQPRR